MVISVDTTRGSFLPENLARSCKPKLKHMKTNPPQALVLTLGPSPNPNSIPNPIPSSINIGQENLMPKHALKKTHDVV